MATFSELQTRVQRRVIDLPAAVQAEIPTLINEAMKQLQRRHNFKVMERVVSFTTVAGTQVLGAVPSDWKEWRDFPFHTENLGRSVPMSNANAQTGPKMYYPTDAEGFPQIIVESEPIDEAGTRNFILWPIPDGNSDYDDGEYRITIPYWAYLPKLSDSSATNWFTVEAEEYLVNKATAEAFSLDWDEERMAVWSQLAESQAQQIILTDKRNRLAGVNTLVPHYKGALSPNIRR